ncbi:hypothetical protein EVAR_6170_1 [Eumeta japonica]|uniref:Uncharacterized protein n=1 Tax=Eumeta variegata TaxID=151549 RepID=A0A4C1TH10_EUMVA|nr:hypothetical protein EVAR_6170_1 [Eumeta japonica]
MRYGRALIKAPLWTTTTAAPTGKTSRGRFQYAPLLGTARGAASSDPTYPVRSNGCIEINVAPRISFDILDRIMAACRNLFPHVARNPIGPRL